MTDFVWTDERVEKLRKLWDEGLSDNEIAARLTSETEGGGTCTRNSIIGKVHRLGLPQRVPRVNPNHVPPRPKPLPASKPQSAVVVKPPRPERLPVLIVNPAPSKPLSLPPADVFDPGDRQNFSLLDLRQGMCRWPFGESPIRYCGATTTDPVNPECPYCAEHAALAYSSGRNAETDREAA